MYVPCYILEKTHNLLMEKGFRERMRITRGYVEVLKRCGSKTEIAASPA
jgi:hypothetical protein